MDLANAHAQHTLIQNNACGKIILCGEHAVVYGRPAIALPVSRLRTRATILPKPFLRDVEIIAPDINAHFSLIARPQHPLSQIVRLTIEHINSHFTHTYPVSGFSIRVKSAIPVGSHLGSGAAVSVACARVIADFFNISLAAEEISALAFEIEKIHHGTPSGIDNTVIAFEKPVWFIKGQPPKTLEIIERHSHFVPTSPDFEHISSHVHNEREQFQHNLLPIVIADTGVSSPTKLTVASVREKWQRDPVTYENIFNQIADVVTQAREALTHKHTHELGKLMNTNHALLKKMSVSCIELDHLCISARRAGALGAKLSGGGRGGNIIALAQDPHHARYLRRQLLLSGAKRVWV
jgi:mevalonate kinase